MVRALTGLMIGAAGTRKRSAIPLTGAIALAALTFVAEQRGPSGRTPKTPQLP